MTTFLIAFLIGLAYCMFVIGMAKVIAFGLRRNNVTELADQILGAPAHRATSATLYPTVTRRVQATQINAPAPLATAGRTSHRGEVDEHHAV